MPGRNGSGTSNASGPNDWTRSRRSSTRKTRKREIMMTRLEIAADAFAQPIGTDAIRIERVLPGPRERIWRYLTESDLRRRWLAAGAFGLMPGGAVELV